MLYTEFIQLCRNKTRLNKIEVHHIEPRSIGGVDVADNRIPLSEKDHYNAHKLLALEHPYNLKLWQAWNQVYVTHPNCQKRKDYILIRRKLAELPKLHTEESRRNRSKATKQYMNSLTDEQRVARAAKISKSNKQTYQNDVARKRVSDSLKEKWKDTTYRDKLIAGRQGKHWYTNGIDNKFTQNCPEGYIRGITRNK